MDTCFQNPGRTGLPEPWRNARIEKERLRRWADPVKGWKQNMKETVLLVNFQDPKRLRQVKQALLPLRLRLRLVEPQDFDSPVGWLAEGKGENGKAERQAVAAGTPETGENNLGEPGPLSREPESFAGEPEPLSGELLVFAGFSGGTLDAVLAALRKKQLRIPYKAVLTAANQGWTVRQLHREIQAEHEAMNG